MKVLFLTLFFCVFLGAMGFVFFLLQTVLLVLQEVWSFCFKEFFSIKNGFVFVFVQGF